MPSVCPSAFLRWLFLPPAYPYNPTLFFPFRSVAGRSFPFSKALLYGAVGYKVFPINTLATKQEEDLSGNGATARPFSRHKAPYLLCLYKRKWFAPLSSEKRNRTCNIYHHSDMFACWYVDISSCFPTAVGLAIRNNRHEYRRFLFSPVYNPFQQCPEDFRRSERFDTESEGGYRFKIVNLRLVSVQYADNALYFIKKYPAERKVFFGERCTCCHS